MMSWYVTNGKKINFIPSDSVRCYTWLCPICGLVMYIISGWYLCIDCGFSINDSEFLIHI